MRRLGIRGLPMVTALALLASPAFAGGLKFSDANLENLHKQVGAAKPDKQRLAMLATEVGTASSCEHAKYVGHLGRQGGRSFVFSCVPDGNGSKQLDLHFVAPKGPSRADISAVSRAYDFGGCDELSYSLYVDESRKYGTSSAGLKLKYSKGIGDTFTSGSGLLLVGLDAKGRPLKKAHALLSTFLDEGDSPWAHSSHARTGRLEVGQLDKDAGLEAALIGLVETHRTEENDPNGQAPPKVTDNRVINLPPVVVDSTASGLVQLEGSAAFNLIYEGKPSLLSRARNKFVIAATETDKHAAGAKLTSFSSKLRGKTQLAAYDTKHFSNLKDGLFIVAAPAWSLKGEKDIAADLKRAGLEFYIKQANK